MNICVKIKSFTKSTCKVTHLACVDNPVEKVDNFCCFFVIGIISVKLLTLHIGFAAFL